MEALKDSIANKTAMSRALDSLHTNLCVARTQAGGMLLVADLLAEARDRVALAAKAVAGAQLRDWKMMDDLNRK